jgi:hypothetical protein
MSTLLGPNTLTGALGEGNKEKMGLSHPSTSLHFLQRFLPSLSPLGVDSLHCWKVLPYKGSWLNDKLHLSSPDLDKSALKTIWRAIIVLLSSNC